MSCPRCAGLCYLQTISDANEQFDQWACINCGNRMQQQIRTVAERGWPARLWVLYPIAVKLRVA